MYAEGRSKFQDTPMTSLQHNVIRECEMHSPLSPARLAPLPTLVVRDERLLQRVWPTRIR